MGTPTWSHDGIICIGESYKSKVKLTFAEGASSAEKLLLLPGPRARGPGSESGTPGQDTGARA